MWLKALTRVSCSAFGTTAAGPSAGAAPPHSPVGAKTARRRPSTSRSSSACVSSSGHIRDPSRRDPSPSASASASAGQKSTRSAAEVRSWYLPAAPYVTCTHARCAPSTVRSASTSAEERTSVATCSPGTPCASTCSRASGPSAGAAPRHASRSSAIAAASSASSAAASSAPASAASRERFDGLERPAVPPLAPPLAHPLAPPSPRSLFPERVRSSSGAAMEETKVRIASGGASKSSPPSIQRSESSSAPRPSPTTSAANQTSSSESLSSTVTEPCHRASTRVPLAISQSGGTRETSATLCASTHEGSSPSSHPTRKEAPLPLPPAGPPAESLIFASSTVPP
mmetsp:Transcript_24873/g.81999  ORF Transcript_24873/g.81999 Transcript_24873/m.81999 type:complete len:342 (+) Transcript_24873:787-1812(+)